MRRASRRRAVGGLRGRGIVAATFRRFFFVVIGGGPGHGPICRSGWKLRVVVAEVLARAEAVVDPVGHLAVVDYPTVSTAHPQHVGFCQTVDKFLHFVTHYSGFSNYDNASITVQRERCVFLNPSLTSQPHISLAPFSEEANLSH